MEIMSHDSNRLTSSVSKDLELPVSTFLFPVDMNTRGGMKTILYHTNIVL